MVIVYFSKYWVKTAKDLVKEKVTFDKINARSDIDKINTILKSYLHGDGYSSVFAVGLDKRIRCEYEIIKEID